MCVCIYVWLADTFKAAVTWSDIPQQGKCISLIGTLFKIHHLWTDSGTAWQSVALW